MKRLLLACSLLLASCGGSATSPSVPAPPNSPQTLALNVTKTLADAINAAVKDAIALRNQGSLSPANTILVENWAKSAAALDDQIATELASADTWSVQKAKILVILPGIKIPPMGGIDTTLVASLAAVQQLIVSLQSQVVN